MRISLSVLLASLLTLVAPLPARSFEGCDESMATGAHTRCLINALSAMDRDLNRALKQVAKEAEGGPSEMFRTLWRDNLTSFYNTSPDPLQQAKRFRAERRRICAFAKSIGFQGTGYGIATTRCELALTQTLLEQLQQ